MGVTTTTTTTTATPSAAHYQNVSATGTQTLPGSIIDIVMSDVYTAEI